MKKLISILLFLIFSVGILIAVLFLRAESTETETFTLLVESGTVQYKEPGKGSFTTAEIEETELETDSTIKTGADTFAYVLLPDNSLITIDENTEIEIIIEDEDVTVDQLIGNTWHRVKTLSDEESYEVTTPNTTAAVRGTTFGVEVTDSEEDGIVSDVFVEESIVEVQSIEVNSGVREILSKETLSDGEFANVRMGEDLLPILVKERGIPERIRQTDWYQRNKELDALTNEFDEEDFDNFRDRLEQRLKETGLEFTRPVDRLGERLSDSRTNQLGEEQFQILDSIKTRFQNYGDKGFCEEINKEIVDQSLQELRNVIDMYEDASTALEEFYIGVEYLEDIADFCRDGVIDDSELQFLDEGLEIYNLEDITIQLPTQQFPRINQQGFDVAIGEVFERYLNPGNFQSKDAFCNVYVNSDPETILGEFTATELEFGVEPYAADEQREKIYQAWDVCSDGTVSEDETLQFDSLFYPGN